VQDALPVDDLGVLLERLAPDAVPPFVRLLVEIGRIALEDALDQRANAGAVSLVRGADELIVRHAEPLPHRAEAIGERIDERLRGGALRLGRLGDLLAVLVHADEEVHVVAAQAAVSCDGVGADLLVGVPEMRVAVGVVDRGREVVRGH